MPVNFNFSPATHKSLTTVTLTPQARTFSTPVWTLATPGGVSATSLRVPMQSLNFAIENVTAIINAWGGFVTNEVPVRTSWSFSLGMFQYDDGFEPDPLAFFNYTYGYAKMIWVERSIGGTTLTATHTLYGGIRKTALSHEGDGGQGTSIDLFNCDLVDGSGNQAFYTRVVA